MHFLRENDSQEIRRVWPNGKRNPFIDNNSLETIQFRYKLNEFLIILKSVKRHKLRKRCPKKYSTISHNYYDKISYINRDVDRNG